MGSRITVCLRYSSPAPGDSPVVPPYFTYGLFFVSVHTNHLSGFSSAVPLNYSGYKTKHSLEDETVKYKKNFLIVS